MMTPKARYEEHKRFIRSLPCIICYDDTSTECAHVRMRDPRAAKKITGIGIKPRDCWTVPLCGQHHRQQHEIGEANFWYWAGIDPIFKAMALWINSGDLEAGEEVVKNR